MDISDDSIGWVKRRLDVYHAVLDREDLPLFLGATFSLNKGYIIARWSGGRRESVHREVLAPAPGNVVDHINGNRLNNRRGNLREVTPAQSNQNRYHGSQTRGVSKRAHRWYARIQSASVGSISASLPSKSMASVEAELMRRHYMPWACLLDIESQFGYVERRMSILPGEPGYERPRPMCSKRRKRLPKIRGRRPLTVRTEFEAFCRTWRRSAGGVPYVIGPRTNVRRRLPTRPSMLRLWESLPQAA